VTFYIVLALSTFVLTLVGTRLTIEALRKRTVLLDHPNLRSNHVTPTPRGGGIAVVFMLVIGLLIADINYGIVLAVLLLAAVSLMDDIIGVPALVRFLVQVMAVSIPLSMLHHPVLSEFLPGWLDTLLLAILWIWFTNLFNFMDGIDGISAAEMIAIGAGLVLITSLAGSFPDALSAYSLVIAAAACGFLWWNWHPAKIFLGDVGSIPIGFLLGYILLLAMQEGYGYAVAILPAYYLSDSTITLLKRLWRGKKIWVAHSEHYYQQAVRKGRRHDAVVRYISGINLLLALLATMSVIEPAIAMFNLAMAYTSVFMLLGFFAHTDHKPHHEHF
jgi:UDP-N-acetylmuramyl pentapeptide phosphotransferase/UDP-N-acetylglucosamine-1-phosphate transferase